MESFQQPSTRIPLMPEKGYFKTVYKVEEGQTMPDGFVVRGKQEVEPYDIEARPGTFDCD